MTPQPEEIRERILKQWTVALKKVLTAKMPEPFTVTVQDGKGNSRKDLVDETWTWYSQTLSFSPESNIRVGATNEVWTALGEALLNGIGLEEADGQDIQSTCTDIVAQSNSAMAQEFSRALGREINCGAVMPSKLPGAANFVLLSLTSTILHSPISLAVNFDDSIFIHLDRPSITPGAAMNSASPVPRSLSALRLNLHATLGRTELMVDDVLKLIVGSVIDLGRSVNDPVDVVANGKVIASGQVVAFKGNYAIKVLSSADRTRSNPAVLHGNRGLETVTRMGRNNGRMDANVGGEDE